MRVILKPVGLAIFLLMVGSLSVIAFGYGRWFGVGPSGDGGLLANNGFEEKFLPYSEQPESKKAKISGTVASSWFDNSGWGNVVVVYSQDSEKPYRGKMAQRIDFKEVIQNYGRLQFAQSVNPQLGNGGKFKSRIYVRASQPVEVEFGLRSGMQGEFQTNPTRFKVGTEWMKLETIQSVKNPDDSFFMLNCDTPGVTLWLDEASMERVGD